MIDYRAHFAGKKITVMRIGLLGRGIGDAAFLAEMGAEVHVVDDAPEEVMQSAVDALSDYPNIKFTFGPYQNEHFINCDYVLVGAGAPVDLECLQAAKAASVPLKQSAAWFAEFSEVPVIGVTGTRGKSTVTHMIHHCLSVITGSDVLLGGNIRGVSNLQLLQHVTKDSLAVMELDSWQLQGWGWNHMSPQVAVFTTFMEDHLNYYQTGAMTKEEGMSAYFKDKAQIFLHQDESGIFITTPDVFERAKALGGETIGQEVVLVDESMIDEEAALAMPGAHNRLNAALALEALKALSLSEDEVLPALATFPGVEGRLQYVKTIDNVRIYNDNNATEPNATIAGLKALDLGNKNIILIAGGADKQVDLAPLRDALTQHCKRVILTPGSGTDKLLDLLQADDTVEYPPTGVVDDLAQAVATARKAAANGDIILFSPAFASFSQFKNEYERNDAFLDLVDALESSSQYEETAT